VTVRTDTGPTMVSGLFVVLSPEEVAGPTWKKALGGSGPGRFRGLVEFFFAVFPPSHLPRAVAPCSVSGQSPKTVLFNSENNDCKIHLNEECPMQPRRKMDGTRGNTPPATISPTSIRNARLADDFPLSAAQKRAGFLGWSKALMPVQTHRVSGGSSVCGGRGAGLEELN
jgi:hypothetical protein